jgi:hypothetical protein
MEGKKVDQPAGKRVLVRGTCFAYICKNCEGSVRIAHVFQRESITQSQAELEHAYCYSCYRSLGLDGSEENFQAYSVSPTDDGHCVPSAFSLLEIGLACEALTKPPTVTRVYRQLLEEGMIWTRDSIQAALHVMFPDAFEPVLVLQERKEG